MLPSLSSSSDDSIIIKGPSDCVASVDAITMEGLSSHLAYSIKLFDEEEVSHNSNTVLSGCGSSITTSDICDLSVSASCTCSTDDKAVALTLCSSPTTNLSGVSSPISIALFSP